MGFGGLPVMQQYGLPVSEPERNLCLSVQTHGHQDVAFTPLFCFLDHPLGMHRAARPRHQHASGGAQRFFNDTMKGTSRQNPLAVPPHGPAALLQGPHQGQDTRQVSVGVAQKDVMHQDDPHSSIRKVSGGLRTLTGLPNAARQHCLSGQGRRRMMTWTWPDARETSP